MALMSWLMYLDSLGDIDCRRSRLSTSEFVERVLLSVFHTITIIAVYEIVRETFRRIELIRLRWKVRKYERMIQSCCCRMYGCRTCNSRFRQKGPTITYRSVPTSTYRALDNKVVLWKPQKIPDCYKRYRRQGDSREEIQSTSRYLSDLTTYMRELCGEQDYEIRENIRKYEMMRRRREEDLLLEAMRQKNMCPCFAARSPCNVCNPRLSTYKDPWDADRSPCNVCNPRPSTSIDDWDAVRSPRNIRCLRPADPCSTVRSPCSNCNPSPSMSGYPCLTIPSSCSFCNPHPSTSTDPYP